LLQSPDYGWDLKGYAYSERRLAGGCKLFVISQKGTEPNIIAHGIIGDVQGKNVVLVDDMGRYPADR